MYITRLCTLTGRQMNSYTDFAERRQTTSRAVCRLHVTRWARQSRGMQKQRKVTVPSRCSGMIPSALDEDDTYSVLIPLKSKPLIHPASDLSSPTIIHLASHSPCLTPAKPAAQPQPPLWMNKQNKNTHRIVMFPVNMIGSAACSAVPPAWNMKWRGHSVELWLWTVTVRIFWYCIDSVFWGYLLTSRAARYNMSA